MTVTDSTNLLFEWFSKEDTLELENDFNKLVLISAEVERDKAAILIALDDLKNKQLISSYEYNGKTYWILKQSFSSYNQDVEISALVALGISNIINNFCDMIGDESDKCDPANLSCKDIQNVLFIVGKLSEVEDDKEDID